MTDFPPPPPDAPVELAYQTPPPHGNAPMLVRLAVIFLLVSAGVDLLYAAGMIGFTIFMHYMFTHMPVVPPPAPGAPPGPPAPPPPPIMLFYGLYGIPGVLSLLVITPKIIGAIKLLKGSGRAWGWGLAAAIVCCTELWMIMGCCPLLVLPLGAGIYSIVILCLPHVRLYLSHPDTGLRNG